MPYKRTPYNAFRMQRRGAEKRNVEFKFEFEEWLAWWESNLGPDWFELRGPRTGQYVMARDGDKGPYAAWNVRCAKVEDNHNDYNLTKGCQKGTYKRKHLSRDVVVKIYTSKKKYKDIAAELGLTVHDVHRVKCQKAYVAITKGLEKGRYRFNFSNAPSQ